MVFPFKALSKPTYIGGHDFFHFNGGFESNFFQERDFLLKHGHDVVDFSMAGEKNLPFLYAGFFCAQYQFIFPT